MADKTVFIGGGPTKPDVPHNNFDRSKGNDGTYRFGRIYPIYSKLYPAGTRVKIKPNYGFQMMPMVFPVQTNMRMHMKFYSVPLRILYKDWKNLVSMQGKGYTQPYIARTDKFYETGSLSDYMGLPSFIPHIRERFIYHPTSRIADMPAFSAVQTNVALDDVPASIRRGGFAFSTIVGEQMFSTQIMDGFSQDEIMDMMANGFTLYHLGVDPFLSGSHSIRVSVFNSNMTQVCTGLNTFNCGSQTSVYFAGSDYYITPMTWDGMGQANAETLLGSSDRYSGGSSRFQDFSNFYIIIQWNNSTDALGSPSTLPFNDYQGAILSSISNAHSTVDVKDEEQLNRTTTSAVSLFSGFIGCFAKRTEAVPIESPAHFRVQSGVNNDKPWIPILAYRWRAYEFIFNYFIRNERVTPFMKRDSNNQLQVVYNQYLTNDEGGADSTTPMEFKNAPFEYDMFTTCLKEPTFGDAPLVGLSYLDGDSTAILQRISGDTMDAEEYGLDISESGQMMGVSYYKGDANSPNLARLKQLIEFGISISDIRNASAYQRLIERYAKAGNKYQNLIYEFFGTNPPIGEEFPRYLGGRTDKIHIGKVTNTSGSNDSEYKLGEFAGTGELHNQKEFTIDTYTTEDSIIMGIMWFSITPCYSQMLDRELCYHDLLDYYNPQFANISPQPVYDWQLNPLGIDITNGTEDEIRERLSHVFGYNRPWVDLVSDCDEVHGEFRRSMRNFVLQRVFDGVPELGEDFLYINADDFTDIFSVLSSSDKIYGKVYFDVNAQLPMPKYNVPKIL